MLLVLVRVEFDAERNALVGERARALARLRVPHLDVLVKGRGQEVRAAVVERDVLDGLGVAHVGSQALAIMVHVPQLISRVRTSERNRINLDLCVQAARQKQMSRLGEESDLRHALGVPSPTNQPPPKLRKKKTTSQIPLPLPPTKCG